MGTAYGDVRGYGATDGAAGLDRSGGMGGESWGTAASPAPGGGLTFADAAPWLGVTGLLGGTILDYIGQRQGARAIQREADRQIAEDTAFNAARRGVVQREIARFDPRAEQALSTGALVRAKRASGASLRGGGRALGLSNSAVASAGQALVPAQRVRAIAAGGQGADARFSADLSRAKSDIATLDAEQQLAGSTRDAAVGVAARKGSGYRLAGQMLEGMSPLIYYGMAQPAAGAA